MSYQKDHPKCWTCVHLREHDEDDNTGKAIHWYGCRLHEDFNMDDPQYQYCSEHEAYKLKGGKHDVAPIQ